MERSRNIKMYCFLSLLMLAFSFSPNNDQAIQIKQEIELQANQYRTKNKSVALSNSECLDKAALMHTEYLLNKNELSHFQNKKESKTPTDRVNLLNCPNKFVFENLAYFEYSTLSDAKKSANILMELWVKSKGHRNNLLSRFSKQMGTAVSIDTKNKRVIAVQVFTD